MPLARPRVRAVCVLLTRLRVLSWTCVSSVALHLVESTFLCGFDLDGLHTLRQKARRELLRESRKYKATKWLLQIPCIGPIRAALLLAQMQTPHRFRSKRQLWAYSGLGIKTHDSAQYTYAGGQLQHSKKPQQLRGLNQNHNHQMKEIYKSAAISAIRCGGPFRDLYTSLLAKGMKPEMARLTLARKIAAITLTTWKKGACFDANQLNVQAA